MKPTPRLLQEPRHEPEFAFGTIDPRTSREAAWRAIERGQIFPDPTCGPGPDEEQFPGGMNRTPRG